MTNAWVQRTVTGVAVALAACLALAAPVAGQSGGLDDISDDAYYSLPVRAFAGRGVFDGTMCDDGFCPGEPIDRKTMAVWTVRVLDGRDPPSVAATRFDDVEPTSFHAPYIERMAELGITTGCSDGSRFCSDHIVTRAQMAAFLSRAYSLPDGPKPTFSDVPHDAWYAADVAKLAGSGITVGCGDGTKFCPSQDTTRAQMATFLYRAENLSSPDKGVGSDALEEINYAMDGGGVLSSGPTHSCALRVDQTITCWGANESGKANSPTGKFKAVIAGASHSCGLRVDQTITCWGSSSFGQLDTPASTFNALTQYCGLHTDQTMTCWGLNILGQTRDAPSGTFLAMSTAGLHSCGLRTDQTITCWPTAGVDLSGQPEAPAGKFTAVAVENFHSCAIRTDRTIRCWGANESRQSEAPAGTFLAVAPGGFHSCGLRTDQTITCWGANNYGQSEAPAGTFLTVTAGQLHSCGLRVARTITCWGSNEDLQGRYVGQLDVPSGRFGP